MTKSTGGTAKSTPKEAWIQAKVTGICIKGEQIILQAECMHYPAAEIVASRPFMISDINEIECWAKGIINSSGNILVCLEGGGFAPVGRETGKNKVCEGITVCLASNELSRDIPPNYVRTKTEAEKLCLLHQVLSPNGWTVADIAKASGIDCSRISGYALQTLLRAAMAEVGRREKAQEIPKLSESALKMIS